MKVQKMISIDEDLRKALGELHINVSEECNIHLWTLVTKQESKVNKSEDIDIQIKELEIIKASQEKEKAFEDERKTAGISDKALLFLKNLNSNITMAKSNRQTWESLTGQLATRQELMELKAKWT